MVRFASTLIVGLISTTLLLACGDKQNPLGDYQTPGSSGGTGGGGGGAGGSTGVTYSQTIAPMMAASCAISGCHAGASPMMNIGLDSYDKVKTNAAVANGAIQGGSMPIDPGVALTGTDKQNFQDWVSAGMPN